jgi:CRISPR/Cas system Type II protein with McrA/HNH and RuvC-like nuclease domain
MLEKHINDLKIQLTKLESLNRDFDGWKSATLIVLVRAFGKEHTAVNELEKIKYSNHVIAGSSYSNIEKCKNNSRAILEACISDLGNHGLPTQKDHSNTGLSINLIQNQHQSTNVNLILMAIEEVLTIKQLNELKEIVGKVESDETKKIKLKQKIESFGSNVMSNILANLFSNPNFWG